MSLKKASLLASKALESSALCRKLESTMNLDSFSLYLLRLVGFYDEW